RRRWRWRWRRRRWRRRRRRWRRRGRGRWRGRWRGRGRRRGGRRCRRGRGRVEVRNRALEMLRERAQRRGRRGRLGGRGRRHRLWCLRRRLDGIAAIRQHDEVIGDRIEEADLALVQLAVPIVVEDVPSTVTLAQQAPRPVLFRVGARTRDQRAEEATRLLRI